MPRRIRRECKKLGCLNLTSNANGYCEVHQKETYLSYDRNRQSSSKRGYDSRWRKYRVWFLSLHPICNICKTELATVVDHIVPHKGDMVLFWDKDNHQALCKRCHDSKTAREDGGFGS